MLNARLRYIVCTGALLLSAGAAEVWNAKDYKEWSEADVQRVLNNSPWAQKASASAPGDSSGPSRRGRMGGGGINTGIGGGGSRYPTTPGIGGGYPGGGGGGGGYPGGGGGYPSGDSRESRERMEVVVRWDSAMPVKEALLKSQFGATLPAPGDPNYTLDQPDKDYVITVIGLRPAASGQDDDLDTKTSRRSRLIESTQLQTKSKPAISPEDVKFDAPSAAPGAVQFLFPRSNPIDLDDKEVTFVTQQGRVKVERKFKLKEMVFNGKLSL